MNAPTPLALLAEAADITDAPETPTAVDAILSGSRELAPSDREKLVITEILDAPAKDAKGSTITGIAPLHYGVTDLMIAQLEAEFTGVQFAVDTPEGKAAAKGFVSKLSKLKTGMDAAYKEWNTPIMALTKHARDTKDKVQDKIAALIEPVQAALDIQKAEDDRIKNEKAVAESRRIDEHVGALTQLEKLHERFVSAPSADIEAQIRDLNSFEYLTRRDWEEYMPRAQEAVRTNLAALETHRTNALSRERLAKLEAEQAAKDAEREAAAAAERAERARVDGLKERMTNIQTLPSMCIGMGVAEIQGTLNRLNKTTADMFAEFAGEAQTAIDNARANLETMLEQAKELAELAEFRAAKARKAQEDAEAAERAEREAAEAKAAAERAEADRIEAAARAERERIAEEQRAERERAERTRSIAQSLLDIARRAMPFVEAAEQSASRDDLLADINSALISIEGV